MEKKKRFSASQFSIKFLKQQGYCVQNVEQTVRWPKKGAKIDVRDVFKQLQDPCDHRGDGLCCEVCAISIINAYADDGWEMHKRDLWNFADLVAVKIGEQGTLYIQTTTADHAQDRIQKIAGIVEARTILAGGNRIHVHGWKQKGGKNGVPKSYSVTVTQVSFDQDGLMETKVLPGETFSESTNQSVMDFSDGAW